MLIFSASVLAPFRGHYITSSSCHTREKACGHAGCKKAAPFEAAEDSIH